VTFSSTSSFASGSAWRKRPGMIRSAPHSAAAYGSPHALAWNIGTTGRIRSALPTDSESRMQAPTECRVAEQCEYSTPFGLPVVPLV
jgi:hypothetical protein